MAKLEWGRETRRMRRKDTMKFIALYHEEGKHSDLIKGCGL
jgi:hypothetical protein